MRCRECVKGVSSFIISMYVFKRIVCSFGNRIFFFLAFYHHSLNVKLLCHIQTIFFKGVPHYEAESFLKKSPVKV